MEAWTSMEITLRRVMCIVDIQHVLSALCQSRCDGGDFFISEPYHCFGLSKAVNLSADLTRKRHTDFASALVCN